MKVLTEYRLDPARLRYLSADNASVNGSAIKKLRKAWRVCVNVTYAPCLTHCFSLFIEAFFAVVEDALQNFSMISSVGAFFSAVGSSSRHTVAIMLGLTPSAIGATNTRWISLLACNRDMLERARLTR